MVKEKANQDEASYGANHQKIYQRGFRRDFVQHKRTPKNESNRPNAIAVRSDSSNFNIICSSEQSVTTVHTPQVHGFSSIVHRTNHLPKIQSINSWTINALCSPQCIFEGIFEKGSPQVCETAHQARADSISNRY